MVWPVSRAVASMPPAAPARSRGAEVSIIRLLGDWKKPKPRPQSTIRQPTSSGPAVIGITASETRPRLNRPSPTAQSTAVDIRSASQPASGAISPTATGQGVMRRPVSTWL